MSGYEVGSAFLTVMPSAKGFGSSLNNELDGPFQAAGHRGGTQIGDGVTKGGKPSFMAAGGALGGAFAAAFVAVGALKVIESAANYLSDAITAASNLAETQSKVEQVFGSSSNTVKKFAKNASTALGQSEQAALDGASTFGIFGKSAGLAGEDLSVFSTEMLTLATDLASFNNTSTEDAIGAIGSAMRGEAEPIRAYGVLLDEATLKNRALAMGLISSTKDALTPQQKVLAAHGEILAQTSTQQGDFSRTSEGMANQQRILTAEMEDTKAEIGEALLPIALDLFKMFAEEGVPMLKELAAWFTTNKDGIREFALGTIDAGMWIIQAFLGIMEHQARMQEFWIMVSTNMVQTWLNVVESVVNAAVNMFGWVPGVGDKLREVQDGFGALRDDADAKFGVIRAAAEKTTEKFRDAQDAVQGLRDRISALDGMEARVRVVADASGILKTENGGAVTGRFGFRASGGPVRAGSPYVVGENEAELFVPDRNGTIYNQKQLAQMGSGSSGAGITQNVYPTPGLSEQQIGDAAARQLAWAMRG